MDLIYINLDCKDIVKNWFTNWVVDERNRLSSHVVSANTIDSFKRGLDAFMDGRIHGDGWCSVYRSCLV